MLKLQSRLGDWEFIRPGRELLKEGELQKISRKGVGPRYFILLSDCLLYTSYHGSWAGDSTSLKVTYTIPLNQLHVHVPTAEDFQNEFSITSNVRSCTLKARYSHKWEFAICMSTTCAPQGCGREEQLVGRPEQCHRRVQEQESNLCHPRPPQPRPEVRGKGGRCCSSLDSRPASYNVPVVQHRVLSGESATPLSRLRKGCLRSVQCQQGSSALSTGETSLLSLLQNLPLFSSLSFQFEPSRVCDACYDAVERSKFFRILAILSILFPVYGEDIDLRLRFKRRELSRSHVARFVPQRLKLSANSEGGQVSGYLRKKQRGLKWKRSWFVLKDRVLYTYKASEDTVATDTLPVLGWSIGLLDKVFNPFF